MKKGFDYIGVTICFYCRDEQGKWDCGGGALEFGETFVQAVKRELKEEYCVDIADKNITYCGMNNVLRKHRPKVDRPMVETHWIAIIFACLVNPKKIKIGDRQKIAEIGWFEPNKLPKPLHSAYLTHLEFVKKTLII